MALTNLSQVTSSGIHTLSNYTTHNINSTGIITASSFSGNLSSASGISTFAEIRVTGNLTVEGTTTTLDSVLNEVDRLEIGANTAAVGLAVTQSGTGAAATFEGGSVGIGTDNPLSKLHLSNAGAEGLEIYIANSPNINVLQHYNRSASSYVTHRSNALDHRFETSGTEKLRITSAGLVGIGTITPSTALEIRTTTTNAATHYRNNASNGGAYFGVRGADLGAASAGEAYIYSYNSGINLLADGTGYIDFSTGGTASKVRIDSSGRLLHKTLSYSPEWGAGLISHKPEAVTTTYFRPSGQYTASLGRVDNTNTTQFIAIDSNYAKSSSVSAGIFLSAFHADAGGSACGHTIKNVRTDAGGLIFSSVATAASINNPAVETERLRITTAGNIGISETTPDSKVDILHSTVTNSATENLIHLRTDPGAGYVSRGLFIKIGRDANYDNSAAHYDIVGSAGNSGFHAFEVQGDEKLRITKDGKIGIGTDSPGSLLHISGVDASGARIKIEDNNNGFAASEIGVENGGRDLKIAAPQDIYFEDVDTGVRHLYIESGGHVGIGTDNPGGQSTSANNLVVADFDGEGGITIKNANDSSGNIFFADTAGSAQGRIQYNHVNDYMRFYTNGNNERLRIRYDGNIGIGTYNPGSLLHIQSTSANQNVLTISADNGRDAHIRSPQVSDSNTPFTFYTNNAWRFDVDSIRVLTMTHDYKVGIKTDVPISDFTVLTNGNGYFTVNGSGGNGAELLFHKKDKSQTYSIQNNGGANELVQHVLASTSGEYSWYIGGQNASNLKMRLTSAGNVGIGTDNPTQKLYVNGTTRLGGGLNYGSTTILSIAPGVVKWDTSGVSGGRLNADQNGNWYLNNKSYPVYHNLGVNMNDIYGANSAANNIGSWVYLGSTQHSAPYPRKVYKISAPNSTQGTFVYQVWFNGDANYQHGGLYEIRINNWSESTRFTSVTITCINGVSDGVRVYAYNNANGIWITTNSIWGSLYIRKFGYDDSQRSRGSSLCAVDNGAHLAVADVNGSIGTIPSGYTEVHASDSGGGGYNIENNSRFGAGGN